MSKTRSTSVQLVNRKSVCTYLVYVESISAGFPSPADDYLEKRLSIDDLVIKDSSSTFFAKIEGYSMSDANIQDGDIVVVDRSLNAKSQDIIVAMYDGEFTVKRLIKEGNQYLLRAAHANYKDIIIMPDSDFKVWGVVTYIIHKST